MLWKTGTGNLLPHDFSQGKKINARNSERVSPAERLTLCHTG